MAASAQFGQQGRFAPAGTAGDQYETIVQRNILFCIARSCSIFYAADRKNGSMNGNVLLISGVRVFSCGAEGPRISAEAEVNDLVSEALGQRADVVVLPIERLTEDFLRLRTGFAGLLIQKFVNYRLCLAIIGDIESALARSEPLRNFVYESNRGTTCWFFEDVGGLGDKLRRTERSST
ncbi:DUF4180 domain-containing protein [Methylocystis sp. MJC1]|uniref:DUF4180 domain-containing protein n=1 Tax=Methylocystis sp. MJC1 TaxID=2654282 RepID=UPI0027D2CBDE|nr:DUF4180 domain-containing protein [Methylocystis sp. MJC1]